MKTENTIGESLLAHHQSLSSRLASGGDDALISLIAACIDSGIIRFRDITDRVNQIAEKDISWEVAEVLTRSGHFAQFDLPWFCDDTGQYGTLNFGFEPSDMSFWCSAKASS